MAQREEKCRVSVKIGFYLFLLILTFHFLLLSSSKEILYSLILRLYFLELSRNQRRNISNSKRLSFFLLFAEGKKKLAPFQGISKKSREIGVGGNAS